MTCQIGFELISRKMPMVLRAWLREHTAEDVLKSSKMPAVYNIVQPDSSLETCLASFVANHQQSLLIRDARGIISWLHIEDIIRIALDRDPEAACTDIPTTHCIMLPGTVSIWNMLVAWDSGVDWHRPLVITSPGHERSPDAIIGIVSPLDVLHYIYIYGWQLSTLLGNSVHLLDWDGKALPLLYRGESAYKALDRLLDSSSPGILGLVERRGNLIGDISLQNMLPLQEEYLDLSIRDYLEALHYKYRMVTCSERLTFGDLLAKVLMNETNYVWKLDASGHPIGLIHLSHMLRFVKRRATQPELI